MDERQTPISQLFEALKGKAKELNCLFEIEELLKDYDKDLKSAFEDVIKVIVNGLQYPDFCRVRITYLDKSYYSPNFVETEWKLSAYIAVQDRQVGSLDVFYIEEMPQAEEGPFLKEEVRLIITIARRLGDFIQHMNLRRLIHKVESVKADSADTKTSEWQTIVELTRRMDQDLHTRIARKMLNYLCWNGIDEANTLLQKIGSDKVADVDDLSDGSNRPRHKYESFEILPLTKLIFDIANRNLPDEEILSCVQRWMQEDRASFLIKTLVNLESSLGDIADAIRRFVHLSPEGIELPDSTLKGVRVSLVRQLITDQLDYIKIAKNFVEIEDFYELIHHMVYPVNSHGQVGGKSAGLFLAWHILKKYKEKDEDLKNIKIPKTWYITSDGLHNFMHYNDLEEITEQKYKDVSQVRQEYPYIIQLFKNSQFTPEIIQGLSMALDDFGKTPIIVRSSSLLEDRFGAAFSGKYKSLFLANQGSKKERLQALMDAIAEVYSSTFGSDPIEYRAERGLIDFKEEMGIIIQEVVGRKVGDYFLPAYAGVAFSNNEFRWSPRIKYDDGLIRIVPGLGTRAVDRLSDDYPILIAPGQPDLRVNISSDEIIRYSPNKIDVINLVTNCFETVDVKEFFRKNGDNYPEVTRIVSVIQDDSIQQRSLMNLDFERDEIVITFEGLIAKTAFVKQMRKILKILQDTLSVPVDIEFASDGRNFYLLQCRPQGTSLERAPASIPKRIKEDDIVFTAHKYVSNGVVSDITHIVYVDPAQYSEITEQSTLMEVGKTIGKLNKLLPKRQFILMGPGRWGSRGDIKLGVNVTYSDISNTAMLIEIARQKGHYVPDLSFGTHFFQDLVEASIRYLPLYPDEERNILNEGFLSGSSNILSEILPEFATLDNVVKVIDVQKITGGKVMKIFMNAEIDEAVGALVQPSTYIKKPLAGPSIRTPKQVLEDHWRWRLSMAERIASNLDTERFCVKGFYVIGSTKNRTARPNSDINLLVHFRGSDDQREKLMQWFEGWSLCLDEINYLRTGYHHGGLLDVHLITDEDLKNQNSYAMKIGAVTDAAKEIPLKKAVS